MSECATCGANVGGYNSICLECFEIAAKAYTRKKMNDPATKVRLVKRTKKNPLVDDCPIIEWGVEMLKRPWYKFWGKEKWVSVPIFERLMPHCHSRIYWGKQKMAKKAYDNYIVNALNWDYDIQKET
jgi:hypothetical protein